MRILPVLLVLVLALGACSPPAAPRGVEATADATTCDDATREELDRVVAAQLDAFADDRWDDALGFASTAFRDDFDPSRLASMIEGAFPVAADAVGHELGPCVAVDEQAQVLVSVVDDDGERLSLGYLLVLEDAGWRIAGAVPVGRDAEESGPLV